MSGVDAPTSFIADSADPLLGWASTTELELSRQLSDLDFAVEVNLSGDELERLDRFWGRFVTRQISAGAELSAVLEACPAIVATTLVGRAGRIADLSNFDSEYWAGLGVPRDLAEQFYGCFDGHVAEILSRAGLDPMDIAASGSDGELGRLLVHATIPAGWIPSLIALIDEDPDNVTGASLTEHFVETSPTRQLGPLCTVAPERATRLFDDIIEFYRWAAQHPYEVDQWAEWGVGKDGSYRVPLLILEDLVDELRERPAGTVDRLSTVGTASWETSPRLVYDVNRERVVLRLPQMPLDETVVELRWRVSIDGEVVEYRTGYDNDTEGFSEILDVPVRKAAREIVVKEIVRRVSWTIPVLSEPFLAFTMRGHNVTSKVSLHHTDLIVVSPDDAEIVDPVRETPLPADDGVELRSWNGWIARTVDVNDAASFQVRRPGEPAGTALRSVDPRQRVIFTEGELCSHVRSVSGLPVHSESLLAEFPATLSGADEVWYLSISSYAGPGQAGVEVTPAEPVEVPADGGAVYVFDPDLYESPWTGEYIVRLRGPRNESFRHRYAIVQGLVTSLEDNHGFRIPVAGGLSPMSVELATEKPASIEPNPVEVGADSARGSATVSTDDGDLLPIVVTPPRLRFQVPLKGEEARWRSTPLVCAGSELNGDMFLRVRTGSELHKPVITARNHHGSPVRTKKMITWDGMTWRIPLKDFASALASQSGGSIELSWVDEETRKSTSVRLVTLAPTPEWQIELKDDTVVVSADKAPGDETSVAVVKGSPDGRPLGLWMWPTTAPWRRALSVRVVEGEAALPEELRNVGPLVVQVYCADVSENLRAPARPGPQAVVVDQPGYATGHGLDSLSAFLAGESKEIEGGAETFSLLWDLQAGWMSDSRAFTSLPRGAEVVRDAFLSKPSVALVGLAQSLVDASKRPSVLISSGLVRSAFDPTAIDSESLTSQGSAAPWIGALGALAEVERWDAAMVAAEEVAEQSSESSESPDGDDGDAGDNGDGKDAASDLAPDPDVTPAQGRNNALEKLRSLVGDRAVEAFTTGRDQSLDNACLDPTTVHIARMPEAQQKVILQQFLDSAGIMPGPISEDNSRLLAVLETFSHREELTQLLGEEDLMVTAAKLLKRIRHSNRQLYAAARVRFDRLEGVDTESVDNRWALAPIVSLVFALAARLEAHGAGKMGALSPQAVAGWARVAEMLPDLVAGDIVSADAMVLGVVGHKRK